MILQVWDSFAGYEPEGIVPNRSKSFRSQQLEILQLANSGWIIFISYQTLLGGASHLATTQQLWLTVVPLRMGLWQTPYLFGRTSWLTKLRGDPNHVSKSWEPILQVYTANHQAFGRCLAAAGCCEEHHRNRVWLEGSHHIARPLGLSI